MSQFAVQFDPVRSRVGFAPSNLCQNEWYAPLGDEWDQCCDGIQVDKQE